MQSMTQMSNAGALQAFSNNKPLQTIAEAANSDYASTERGDSRLQQYEETQQPWVAKSGTEEWQSSRSDTSVRFDQGRSSPRIDVPLRTGYAGLRTRSTRQAPSHDSDGSDHASIQKSSPRGSGTFSVEGSNTDATSAMQHSSKENQQSDNEQEVLAPQDDFDLAAPVKDAGELHSLETLSDLIFAPDHLKNIFADPSSLLGFTSFLSACRPKSIPMLMYYLDATEALKALNYSITIAEALEPIPGHDFTSVPTKTTMNSELEAKVQKAFDVLVHEDLPAFVTQMYVQTVKSGMMRRIMAPSDISVRDIPDGLLEVFCLTDPSRPDNPIVFASEAFHQMTRYSMGYIIGRNCRFLQGPKTQKSSVDRIRNALAEGRDHCELILNYRRDGSPFMNLLMLAALRDINGKIRYILGAQIDVSNLVPDSTDSDGGGLRNTQQLGFMTAPVAPPIANKRAGPRGLGDMLDQQDRNEIQKWRAGTMHEHSDDDVQSSNSEWRRPRVLLRDMSFDSLADNDPGGWVNGKLSGFYQNYLLIRPYPSLRVLFASPSLRIPQMLQSPILDRIGGSPQVRDELTQALAHGNSVTAKIRWSTGPGERGRNRWIAFTPLVGSHNQIGVWIAILVDDELDEERPRQAPPVTYRVGTSSRVTGPKQTAPAASEHSLVASRSDRAPETTVEKPPLEPDRPIPPPKEPSVSMPSPTSANRSVTSTIPEIDQNYETLEERLRKKRERDAARLLAQPGVSVKPTYKSLSPYGFMNNNGP